MSNAILDQSEVDKLNLLAASIFEKHHGSFAKIKAHTVDNAADEFMLKGLIDGKRPNVIVISIVSSGKEDETSQAIVESFNTEAFTPANKKTVLLEDFSGPYDKVYAELDLWISQQCANDES